MRVLVLGGYGLIGLEIVCRLNAGGVAVVGLGRSRTAGLRAAPAITWIGADIARLTTPEAWAPHLEGVTAVVNAAGALQDGARDDLTAVHDTSVRALIAACAQYGVRRFVQISAPRATIDADSRFLSTKAAGDQALRESVLDWIIFKPGLVISANAYGGTSLLRTLAAFPLVQPLVLASRRIQTVAADDVAEAVAFALSTNIRGDFELVEEQSRALADIVARFRAWLGFAPAVWRIDIPEWMGLLIARIADGLGWLGWRSPLRTTAVRYLADGVTGSAAGWRAAGGAPLKSLDQTLADLPATAQERIYARAQLVTPVLIAVLGAFWFASGVIGFWSRDAAAALVSPSLGAATADTLVVGGATLDILIGLAVFVRAWTRGAALAAIAVSLGYLVGATLLTPGLWLDPLGPLVKVGPAIALSLAVAALVQER